MVLSLFIFKWKFNTVEIVDKGTGSNIGAQISRGGNLGMGDSHFPHRLFPNKQSLKTHFLWKQLIVSLGGSLNFPAKDGLCLPLCFKCSCFKLDLFVQYCFWLQT